MTKSKLLKTIFYKIYEITELLDDRRKITWL